MSKAVKNKEHPHPAGIRRAAVVYTVNESGFTLMDSDLLDLMNKLDESGDDHYSATMRRNFRTYGKCIQSSCLWIEQFKK